MQVTGRMPYARLSGTVTPWHLRDILPQSQAVLHQQEQFMILSILSNYPCHFDLGTPVCLRFVYVPSLAMHHQEYLSHLGVDG